VQGVHAVEFNACRTGAGEGGGNFPADVAGFADADDDDLASSLHRLDNQLDRAVERFVELRPHGLERGKLDVEDFTSMDEMRHKV
jgi:hypothetical protein